MLTKVEKKQMLYNTLKIVKLEMPREAETGNAGGQPVRNSSANVNSGSEVTAKLPFYTIYITMPKKTQKKYFLLFSHFTLAPYILHKNTLSQKEDYK